MFDSPQDKLRELEQELKRKLERLSLMGRLPKRSGLCLGKNSLTDKNLTIPLEKFFCHTHVMGRTGRGKSKALEILARGIIDAGYGFILIDGKGDLYDSLLKYCVSKRQQKKTIIIDPNDQGKSIGLNYLELFGDTTAEAWAEFVKDGLMKLFKQEEELRVWYEEFAPPAIVPLILNGLTLCELSDMVSVASPDFRSACLSTLGPEYDHLRKIWLELIGGHSRQEVAKTLSVIRTRAHVILNSPTMKAMFGQAKTSINWRAVMDNSGILLANCFSATQVGRQSLQMMGIALLHQILINAYSRPKGKRRPFFVLIDEFQNFLCGDVEQALAKFKGFGVYLILSHQNRSQVEAEDPALWDAILGNCDNKLYFSMSYKDADELFGELFAGYIRGDIKKYEILQTKFRPIKTRERVYGESSATGRGRTSGSASGLAHTQAFGPEGFIPELLYTTTADSSSFSSGSSESSTEGYSVADVPWYDYQEFQEVSSIGFYSIQEIVEKFKAWIVKQDPRHAQLKIGTRKPIPIFTSYIEDMDVFPSMVRRFKEHVYNQYALPTPEVIAQINERVPKFLEAHKPQEAVSETGAKADPHHLPKDIKDKKYADLKRRPAGKAKKIPKTKE